MSSYPSSFLRPSFPAPLPPFASLARPSTDGRMDGWINIASRFSRYLLCYTSLKAADLTAVPDRHVVKCSSHNIVYTLTPRRRTARILSPPSESSTSSPPIVRGWGRPWTDTMRTNAGIRFSSRTMPPDIPQYDKVIDHLLLSLFIR